MQFAINHAETIIKFYLEDKMSASEIAKELGTYTLNVTRALKYLKIPIRSKSETQSLVLEQNKAPHPTKGKKLSKETKAKIGNKIHDRYEALSDEEKQERSDAAKERWDNYSDDHIERMRQLSYAGIRRSSKEGSRLEHEIIEGLKENGIVAFHHHNLNEQERLEVDVYCPHSKVAIEIDGPAHYQPIWGHDALARHQKADAEKNGILLLNGFHVIRVKNLVNRVSDIHKRNLLDNILKIIDNPPKNKIVYINIETGEIE